MWWDEPRGWFAGEVTKAGGGKHYVEYDNGDNEWQKMDDYINERSADSQSLN